MTAYNDDQLTAGEQYYDSLFNDATLFEFIGESSSAIIMREVNTVPLSYHPFRKGYSGKWYK